MADPIVKTGIVGKEVITDAFTENVSSTTHLSRVIILQDVCRYFLISLLLTPTTFSQLDVFEIRDANSSNIIFFSKDAIFANVYSEINWTRTINSNEWNIFSQGRLVNNNSVGASFPVEIPYQEFQFFMEFVNVRTITDHKIYIRY
jgi:hypothetical protein